MLLEHIDAIARRKQRHVLVVKFHSPESDIQHDDENLDQVDCDWKMLPILQQLIDWLNVRGIGWRCCGPVTDIGQMVGSGFALYASRQTHTTCRKYPVRQRWPGRFMSC